MKESIKKKIYILVSNHYDLAWRRRAYEGMEDKGRYFVSYADLQRYGITENIRFCRKYPFYKFNVESVSVLRHYLRTNPEYADDLCELIRQNRCSTPQTGDNIIDVNLVSGESLVRNFTFGRDWLKELFEKVSSVCVRNDAFGNSAQLPQIARQCGCDWIWGLSYTPVSGTYWRGLDGTTIYVGQLADAGSGGSWKKYAPCTYCKGYGCDACSHLGIDREAAESTLQINFDPEVLANADEALLSVTSEEMLPAEMLIQWYRDHSEIYHIEFVTYDDLHEIVKEKLNRVPSENELHHSVEHNPNNTGCYSTRIRTKQDVRRLEYRTFRLETLAALLSMQGGDYPYGEFAEIWEQLLTLMAHDIITGEHVDAVYEDFLAWVRELDDKLDRVQSKLLIAAGEEKQTITVFNPNSVTLTDAVEIVMATDGKYAFYDEQGNAFTVLSQNGKSCRVLVSELKPNESIKLRWERVSECPKQNHSEKTGAPMDMGNVLQTFADVHEETRKTSDKRYVIESDYFCIEADDFGLCSVYGKKQGKMLSEMGTFRPAELVYEHDEGSPWATLSPERSTVPIETRLVETRYEKNYQALIYAFEIGSTASYAIHALHGKLEILLYQKSSRVDFRINLFCDDFNHRLRMVFPISGEEGVAIYGIPYGSIVREDYEPQYYWAGSNGDWCAVNWGGISRADGSVAILNRGTPSYRIWRKDGQNLLAVTLLRSPSIPTYLHEPDSYSMTAWDGMRDAGNHSMELSLVSYDGALEKSTIVADAEAYNMGGLILNGSVSLPAMPTVENGSVCLTSLHRTKDGRIALRLVETGGKKTDVRIRLFKDVQKAYLSSITEEQLTLLDVIDDVVCLKACPYEIITLVFDITRKEKEFG